LAFFWLSLQFSQMQQQPTRRLLGERDTAEAK